jgi:hypothetical protein
MAKQFRSTTILGVRRNTTIALGGDGQVTFGDMALKQKAVKVRKFESDENKVLGGFCLRAISPNVTCPSPPKAIVVFLRTPKIVVERNCFAILS